MKAYLLTYSQACAPTHVQDLLNDTQAVETWVAPFPYAAILVSKRNVHDLAAVLRDRLPGVWFMVTELNSHAVQGWLPGNLWEYVNDPQQAWSRKLLAGLGEPPPSPPARSSSSELAALLSSAGRHGSRTG